jgi:hypothetical protein
VKRVVADSMRNTMTVKGDLKESTQTFRESSDSAISLFPPWGIDRLNQPDLPLDKKYSSYYTGERESVTMHLIEFGFI